MKTTPMFSASFFRILAIGLLLTSQVCAAQSPSMLRQTLGSAGGSSIVNTTAGSYVIQQSIGQGSVIGTHKNGSKTLRQGFIQPQTEATAVKTVDPLTGKVYPNPTTTGFNLQFDETLNAGAQLTIYAVCGRAVHSVQLGAGQRTFVSLSSLPQGAYTLRVTYESRVFTSIIIKQ